MKILLADPSGLWCDALEEQLKSHYTILRCQDGREVLPLLREHNPDLLLLGMDLPYVDGLTLLHLIRSSGIQVRILTASAFYNDYIVSSLSQFKIAYMLTKPCTVCTAISQIYQILHYDADKDMQDDPNPVLLAMGLRMNLSGYSCLCAAIKLLRENPGQGISKVLYPDVAKICGGTAARVERAIRGVINDAWSRRDDRIWQAYFPADRQGRIDCPSNGVFITRIALGGKDNRACG